MTYYTKLKKLKNCNKVKYKNYLDKNLNLNKLNLNFNIISTESIDLTYVYNIMLLQLITLQTPHIKNLKKSYQKNMFLIEVNINDKTLLQNFCYLWNLLLSKSNRNFWNNNKESCTLKDLSKLPTNVSKNLNYKNNLILKIKT